MEPHKFNPYPVGKANCITCGKMAGHGLHQFNLTGMEGADREAEQARQQAEAEALSQAMRETKNISRAAGEMERHSPLFYGTGDNPLLF